MAEILGAVTGVMGAAGVALQFAESIKKLHQFCKTVKKCTKGDTRRGREPSALQLCPWGSSQSIGTFRFTAGLVQKLASHPPGLSEGAR